MIRDLFKHQIGINIISIILGLGLATLFNKACIGDGCAIYKLPTNTQSDTIENKIFSLNDKCYKYVKNFL